VKRYFFIESSFENLFLLLEEKFYIGLYSFWLKIITGGYMDTMTGAQLKAMRESMGISQNELSRLAGISQAHVAKIENGRVNPRLLTVNRIISVLTGGKKARPCREIMSGKIVRGRFSDSIEMVAKLMKRLDISQVPVFEKGRPVGSVGEGTIVKNIGRNLKQLKVRDVVEGPFPIVSGNDPIDILPTLLEFHPAVLVSEKGRIAGIITKSNLLGIK